METFDEIRQILKEVAIAQKEISATQKETAREIDEMKVSQKETDRKLKEVGKQIGGIGERFGYFTEGLAINSMERILRRDFKADHITPRSKVYDKTGKIVAEYDVLGWCNSEVNNVVVVEVKTTLRPEYVKEFEETLQNFKQLNPEFGNKNLHGILAFVGNFDKKLENYCQKQGIYTATIHDEVFKLSKPQVGFVHRDFNSH